MPKVTASKASKVPKRALADRTSNQNQDPAQQGNQPLSSTANKRKATRLFFPTDFVIPANGTIGPIDQSDGEVDVCASFLISTMYSREIMIFQQRKKGRAH